MQKIFVASLALMVAAMTSCSQYAADRQSPTDHYKAMPRHTAHHPNPAPSQNQPAHVKAYMNSMHAMHQAMAKGIDAKNADLGFVQGMIPHHQGAIDMANVQLQYGTNPDIRQLASQIKAAQAPEIEQMQNWLKTQGHS